MLVLEDIHKIYDLGKTISEISKELSISRGCIKYLFKQKDILYCNNEIAEEKKRQRDLCIVKLKMAGKSLKQIKMATNVSMATIYRAIDRVDNYNREGT